MKPLGATPEVSILIVEDDRIVRSFLHAIIARHYPGSTLYLAENGRRGLALFQEHTPDVVITDINMPGMNGLEMAGGIKSVDRDAKIIVISAYPEEGFTEELKKNGIKDYLLKPIDFTKLRTAIDRCLAESAPAR